MPSRLRIRMRIEAALAVVSLVLCVVTAISAVWIEELTGWEPDGGNGELEWMIAVGFGVLAVIAGLLTRRDRRLLQAAVA